MDDCFETIDKAASNYAKDTDSSIYQTLVQGLGYNDSSMAIALLKFLNTMIYRAEDEVK